MKNIMKIIDFDFCVYYSEKLIFDDCNMTERRLTLVTLILVSGQWFASLDKFYR